MDIGSDCKVVVIIRNVEDVQHVEVGQPRLGLCVARAVGRQIFILLKFALYNLAMNLIHVFCMVAELNATTVHAPGPIIEGNMIHPKYFVLLQMGVWH